MNMSDIVKEQKQQKDIIKEEFKEENSRPSGGLSRRGARGGSNRPATTSGPVYRKKEPAA